MESLTHTPNILDQRLEKRLLYIDDIPAEKKEELNQIDFLIDQLLKLESEFHSFELVKKAQISRSRPNSIERQIGIQWAKVQKKANAIKK